MKGRLNSLFATNKRKNLPKRVLLLGSGALQIGQAGEFDYSGSQALKALREEKIYTVLINPNIATHQTDKGMADETYFLPVTPYFVEKVLEREKCDAILLSFGGQTALNCGLALEESGVLARLGVQVLGTPVSTIRDTEDRHLFKVRLKEIGVLTAESAAVTSTQQAVEEAKRIGFPVMMRSGFSLGGKGSAIVKDEKQCHEIAEVAFASVPQMLIEECLSGWKEIEYEVVRDGTDNCITVCNMENVDPMGIHTGESIVVAPSQTLDDHEYQLLRDISIKTIRHLGIIGECNIQYALNPKNRQYRVIEVNARLSRSSALASKATGYPLAYVAAKIALGYTLPEIPNSITKVTTAFFEPSLDYIVCKVPRWDLLKFEGAEMKIGSEMKSVGEVMAIGRSFPEALQKALRMIEIGVQGLDSEKYLFTDVRKELKEPSPLRIFAVAHALENGMSVLEINLITGIDQFFLSEIERIIRLKNQLKNLRSQRTHALDYSRLLQLKRAGFSDQGIAKELDLAEDSIRNHRKSLGIRPYLAQIDTLAAEYPAETNFLYFTYAATKNDILKNDRKSVLVLGSGCYRIGSSVEFDWCAVGAVQTARKLGYETVMINCNPETVSTDYDICEKLVFDEISLETVLELYDIEQPEGVFVSMGGQTPNNLALKLHRNGVKILGTPPESIDMAEDRKKFSTLLDAVKIQQPKWLEASQVESIGVAVSSLGGFPVLVRPSYVLSGSAMRVAYTDQDLQEFLKNANHISKEHPVVISKFETFAREVEFDAVANRGEIVLWAISEHIEDAGVHSGDATLVIPPQRLTLDVMRKIKEIGVVLAKHLNVTGPFNIQMLCKNHEVSVIELNLRASRSFPFISKALGLNFIHEATLIILGQPTGNLTMPRIGDLDYVVVKAPQFSYSRIKGADPRLGVEMGSTGEVACFGQDTEEALLKSMLATGFKSPKRGVYILIEPEGSKFDFTREIQILKDLGFKIYTDSETYRGWGQLTDSGAGKDKVDLSQIMLMKDIAQFTSHLKDGRIDWVISVPGSARVRVGKTGFETRRIAADLGVSFTTDIWIARRLVRALKLYPLEALKILPWSSYSHQSFWVSTNGTSNLINSVNQVNSGASDLSHRLRTNQKVEHSHPHSHTIGHLI